MVEKKYGSQVSNLDLLQEIHEKVERIEHHQAAEIPELVRLLGNLVGRSLDNITMGNASDTASAVINAVEPVVDKKLVNAYCMECNTPVQVEEDECLKQCPICGEVAIEY